MSQSLYQNLYTAAKAAYSSNNTGPFIQDKTNEIWRDLKAKSKTKEDLSANTSLEIKRLKELSFTRKAAFTNFFVQVSINKLL